MTTPITPDPIEVGDLVALRKDVPHPDLNLTQGRIGCIREVFSPNEFEVEFVDEVHDRTEGKVRLKVEQLHILRHEVTLDEDGFWNLIETAKADCEDDGKRQVKLLVDRVAQTSIADILAYSEIFSHLHGSAYIIGGGCSDDGFMDFRAWLVAQGKTIFYAVMHDPDILVDVPIKEYSARLESMNYVDNHAYEQKTNAGYIPCFRGSNPLIELPEHNWGSDVDWDNFTVCRLFPKLSLKYSPTEYGLIDWSVPKTEKPTIMEMLHEELWRWEYLLKGLSEETIIGAKLHGGWSIKDLMAHLWAWQQRSIAKLEAALENREPQWPTLPDPEAPDVIDQTNAYIYETYRDLSWQTVHKNWGDGFHHFMSLGRQISEKDMFDAEKYHWLEGYTLVDVLKGSREHHVERREALIS